ncbi:hypothetical protein ACSV9I_21985 [Rhizobium sp. G187]|uniref:hypothetical protein n=1 Tax=Rhizobium sp. G187 TaxID=3451352 RepID=UPI003EE6C922
MWAIPIKFKLVQFHDDLRTYHLLGPDGLEGVALELPTLQDAKDFAETSSPDKMAPFILVPTNKLADTHGFWLQTVRQWGSGKRDLADEKMLVACNSIRRG